jgi:hypothetical protein
MVQLGEDAVLLTLEHRERDGVGVVGSDELGLLALQAVPVGGQVLQLVGLGGHEPIELVVQHPGEGLLHSGVIWMCW